ncbi:hypothetical protein H5410_006657 [Solanum commersonii]|uniref:TF-B3 domain-containing protein n=1 Tax=Solanum commersonii TaxID=4109 RepID=A0A9J6ABY9_SOLCO|nr:hypothetical protein H5410_006657 [Solanum commersonii]
MSWEANIVRKKSNYFICEGEWTQFVVHHQLKLVLAYSQKIDSNISGSHQFEQLSSSSGEKQDAGRKSKRVKTEPIKLSSNTCNVAEEEGVESGNEENGPKKIRFGVVNLNNKDPYYEMVIKKSHSIIFMVKLNNHSIIFMVKLNNLHSLKFFVNFARWADIIGMRKMRLDNGKGKEWQVDIERKQGCVRITSGWPEFKTHNKIATGETYCFKLIQGNDDGNDVLRVQKISEPHSLL